MKGKSHSDQRKRDNVTDRADIHQLPPTKTVNQRQTHEGENKIGDTDTDTAQKSRVFCQTCYLEYARGIIKKGVDTRKLIKKRYKESKHQREFVARTEYGFGFVGCLVFSRDAVHFCFNICMGVNQAQGLGSHFAIIFLYQ